MAKKYLDETGLAYLWAKIKEYFGIKIDGQVIAQYTLLGWEAPSDSTEPTDWTVDQSVIDLYEDLGWVQD